MYTQDPRWLIPLVCLTSDRLFHYQLKQHIDPILQPSLSPKNKIQLLQTAAQDYQFYFGGRLRKEDIENNISRCRHQASELDNLSLLLNLADTFLIWQGDRFEVRREYLNDWMMFCSVIDPAWIIAQSYVQLIKNDTLAEHELIGLITGRQCPFAFPVENTPLQYADNHVHFGGHGYTSLSMLSFVDGTSKLQSTITWPRREEYTLFESHNLDKNKLIPWLTGYAGAIFSIIYSQSEIVYDKIEQDNTNNKISNIADYSFLKNATYLPHSDNTPWTLYDTSLIYQPITTQQHLLHSATNPNYQGFQRWLLYCCGLLLDSHSDEYRSLLVNTIRLSNITRNYMVVSGVGLGQFVDFFRTPVRRANKSYFRKETAKYDFNEFVSREYRFSPDVVIQDEKKPNIYHSALTDFYKAHQQHPEQAHLVIHFTRNFPEQNNKVDKKLTQYRKKLLQQVRAFESFSSSVTLQTVLHQPDITEPIVPIDVRRLVRGYDVAGNENELPIEVFAPVLRVLRAGKHRSGMPLSTRLTRPFITVHAGEDYSHLLSGLRAVDEAVEFCKLEEGDRIGHGLALGTDVHHWAQRQRRAYLTAGQHLDNLVWAYHQSVLLSQHTVEHIPVMHELRDKIHYWSQRIYNNIVTPDLLYRAWILRRNWPDFRVMESDLSNNLAWVPDYNYLISEYKNIANLDDYSKNNSHGEKTPLSCWEVYLNSGLPECREDIINKVISVNCQPEASTHYSFNIKDDQDIVSLGELRLYEAIQDFLMEKYSRKGIVIEACPTSNIYIGRFERYHEHPLFRWNPPHPDWLKPGEKYNRYGLRSGPLSVCINTDDSALMPTTIANEHRIMRETAIQYFGIGTWMADLWINSIREKGVSIFHNNHIAQGKHNLFQ